MSAIDNFVENMQRTANGAKQAQIRFAECLSVDWQARTMDAKGTGDGVDYLDVTLGFGYADIKPAVGSLCLIGIIDGQEVVTFLLNAETVELVEIKSAQTVYNEGKNFGIVKVKELTATINALEKDLNDLKMAFNSWIPPVAPAIDNGAALKAIASTWAAASFVPTTQKEIEDTTITH